MPDATPIHDTIHFLRERFTRAPHAILVLGSGLGGLADEIEDAVAIPFDQIPGFPRRTQELAGHAGRLVAGRLEGVEVAAMQGRFHLYEGWSPAEVALPVRALAALGPRAMLLTNAAGGLRPGMQPGDLMLIADHVNLMGQNPLVGRVVPGETRFPDMSDPYDRGFRAAAEATALELGIPLTQGVYTALMGPSYETPGRDPHAGPPGRRRGGDEHRARGAGGARDGAQVPGDLVHHQPGRGPGRRHAQP